MGLTTTSRTYLDIKEIVESPEGRTAACDAAEKGLPALCGVDRLLREKLGDIYKPSNQGTACAGDLVAKQMAVMDYIRSQKPKRRKCCGDCISKTGIVWVKTKKD